MKMTSRPIDTMRNFLQTELQRDGAQLLPMRLFIGLGWVRAGLEKLLASDWRSGEALFQFFIEQLSNDRVYFPFYRMLLTDLFAPQAYVLSWIIIVGQLLAGVAIMIGLFTNLALLGGLFMNLNFVLAGRVNPSAFYIVIQVALLTGNTGAILGVDAIAARTVSSFWLAAQRRFECQSAPAIRRRFLSTGALSLVAAGLVVPYIRDFSPHSVDDPAMLVLILASLCGLSAAIMASRLANLGCRSGQPEESAQKLH